MLLYDFMYVDLAPDVVRRRLVAEHGLRLIARAALAAGEDEVLRRGTDASGPGPALTASTSVSLGEPRHLGGATLIPLVWRAAQSGDAPLVAADLELAPLSSTRTQLTLLGRPDDEERGPKVIRRRVIQATMRSFLHHLAHDLEQSSSVHADTVPPRTVTLAG